MKTLEMWVPRKSVVSQSAVASRLRRWCQREHKVFHVTPERSLPSDNGRYYVCDNGHVEYLTYVLTEVAEWAGVLAADEVVEGEEERRNA